MSNFTKGIQLALAAAAILATASVVAASTSPVSINLSKPFATRSPWRFTATQDVEIEDPVGVSGGDKAPGSVTVCLRKGAAGSCDPSLNTSLGPTGDLFSAPHYLYDARIVRPLGPSGAPMLLVKLGSLLSGDSDQLILTELLVYNARSDDFRRVYEHLTGHNNNQDVRLVEVGPLAGDIIAAEPTSSAPYGFWVSVSTYKPVGGYRSVLRYRSATTYGDGNPLSVIDSEMPNIEQRLGIWRPGMPLPMPAAGCVHPHLVRTELWCK
jgi:hypothetical protein